VIYISEFQNKLAWKFDISVSRSVLTIKIRPYNLCGIITDATHVWTKIRTPKSL